MSRTRRQRERAAEEDRPHLDGKAPIKAAAFAVLLDEPGLHGYKVATRINKLLGWAIDPKHIYEPLKQLESSKLIWSRTESIDKPPGYRRLYYPTAEAKQAREGWFAGPPAISVLRADIHARLAFSSEADAPDLLRALAEYREDLLEAIELNAIAWAAPKESWLGFTLGHLRGRVDRQCEAEIAWVNELVKDVEERTGKEG